MYSLRAARLQVPTIIYETVQVPRVIEVQINVPKTVSRHVAVQDPDYEVFEEVTEMVQVQIPNPAWQPP